MNELSKDKDINWQLGQIDKVMAKLNVSVNDPLRRFEIGKLNAIKDSIKKSDKKKERKWEVTEVDKLLNEMKNPKLSDAGRFQTFELNKMIEYMKNPIIELPKDWEQEKVKDAMASVTLNNKNNNRKYDLKQLN